MPEIHVVIRKGNILPINSTVTFKALKKPQQLKNPGPLEADLKREKCLLVF